MEKLSFCDVLPPCLFPVVEGLALLDLGVSPYSGDVFHEVRDPLKHPQWWKVTDYMYSLLHSIFNKFWSFS